MSSRMRDGGRCCSKIRTPNGASASSIAFTTVGGATIMPTDLINYLTILVELILD